MDLGTQGSTGVCASLSDDDAGWKGLISAEHIDACRLAGADLYHALEIIDLGFWNQTLLDPETAVSGFISLPIGPWARCKIGIHPFGTRLMTG